MADKKVLVSDFAMEDLREIVAYYQSLNKNYVEKVIAEFEENIFSLKQFPRSGRIVPELERQGIENYRELIHHPYRIIYEIQEDAVIIHTIIDGRRNFQDLIISKLTRNN